MAVLNTMNPIIAKLRQWAYPREFRIAVQTEDFWVETLGAALSQALSTAKSQDSAGSFAGSTAEPLNLINPDFLISFCNGHFRLRRNAMQMEKEGQSSKELRSITRTLERVDELLEENDIQCIDLTDEPYDAGRNDFEPLGEPEEIPGLIEKKISRCERPAIWLKGKLIQPARGIVARPA